MIQDQNQQSPRISIVAIIKRTLIALTTLAILIWMILGAGDCMIRRLKGPAKPVVHEIRVFPQALYAELDKEIIATLNQAETVALHSAEKELAAYFQELQAKTADDFAPWYFSWIVQQKLILNYLGDFVAQGKRTARDRLVETIESEFASRVFTAQTAELRFQRIADNMATVYVEQVRAGLQNIVIKYRIPPEPWTEYLQSLGGIVANINPTRSVSVGSKIGMVAGAAAVFFGGRMLGSLISGMVRKLTGRIVTETVEVTTARAGTVAVATVAGRLLAPILTAGLIGWEWYDHKSTVREQTPILLNCVHDFFMELKKKLLADIKGMLSELKENVVKNMKTKR